MNDQNLINIWKGSSRNIQLNLNYDDLANELKRKANQLDKSIRKRNQLEIGLAILLLPIALYLFFEVPYYLFKSGVLLMAVWFLYVIYKLKKTRGLKTDFGTNATLKHQLNKQKRYVEEEVKLLKSVLYWYLLPPYTGLLLMISSAYFHRDVQWENSFLRGLLSENIYGHLVYIIFLTALYFYIYKLNMKAIAKDLMPVVHDIEKIERELETSEK
ncbi:hypothetical protein SAMN05661096_02351 [Marivirga sericea]|uniref:Uncharacterized protein n=1 Tax=Marivirga sericea TaxID=1028 RepID=A0A1X7K4K0_9BACT|nr:hypothetical protein [Marivirga sericea]SMG35512.1 hypothetical protein SAMN05661096_02351 [Marivirga sericea]